ncbi:MAG: serine/threonine protein kinase [Deltaproteobacteria bacterium]|nr:serine/threonine protein kinase [Deltaproteobacteria bacterium]
MSVPPTTSPSSLASAPMDSEEGRDFLQRRISLFAGLSGSLSLGFFLALNAIASVSGDLSFRQWLWHVSNQLHLAAIAILLCVWLATRTGKRKVESLQLMEAGCAFVVCAAYAMMSLGKLPFDPIPDAQAGPLVLATTFTLMARAILVPSSPRRTLIVTTLASIPLVPCLFILYSRGGPTYPMPAPVLAATVSLWLVLGVIISVVTSRVIYGLRQRVRQAMQLGQYSLEDKIGEGGMGIVYRASHAMLRRPTAIKLLPPERAGESNLLRFEREVQLTARLTHPNTVSIYDYGRTPDGVFYYAMELLDGVDLERLVEADGPQPAARVVHVLRQVCGALAEAHEIGLIHRDIKPANIILCLRGGMPDVVKVVDFGLVKHVGGGESQNLLLTNTNTITGTPLYLAPEAIISSSDVDARSDLYAVGAVGYFLLTGKHVFEGGSVVEICGHHLHTRPRPPSERADRPIPGDVEAAILSCLEKDPSLRPRDARALESALGSTACAHDWTVELARSWWTEKGEGLTGKSRAPRPGPLTPSAQLTRTVAVDLRGRG